VTSGPITDADALAAVDLGSNSFHMLVARSVGGEVLVVDGLKERVALAEGLDDDKNLVGPATERALACLERFGQRIAGLPHDRVRAVGTNTLRLARNAAEFMEKAEAALGHPIEVVAGREEARLIFLGVTHTLGPSRDRRLVVDIGGGSTEVIIGTGFEPTVRDSLFMGCVSFSQRFFGDGRITEERFRKAIIAASLEVRSIEASYRALGWGSAAGSSGTILAIEQILLANRWSDRGITPEGLKRLREALIARGSATALEGLPGLRSDRVSVIASGLAVLTGVVEVLGIDRLHASEGALREGLIYDLLGRIAHEDVRDRTIDRFMDRYGVDRAQADRVAFTAEHLLAGVTDAWDLDDEYARKQLAWAAALHEIGQSLTYSGYHKHSAYLIDNSDMPGFSKDDQHELAAIVHNHRRKVRKAAFRDLTGGRKRQALRLCLVLRLAVLLNRPRREDTVPDARLAADGNHVELRFPERWLDQNPLTREDLAAESDAWRSAGMQLAFS